MEPLGTGAAAVCCMCGDRGLPHELVRCKLCCVRLQHRYCSDLYPRVTAYRRCNWCLREPTEAHAVANKKTETSTSDEEEERQWLEAGCSTTRSKRSAAVGQPVKKHKVDKRPALPPLPGAVAKVRRRVQVRRYKLLAEVISCYDHEIKRGSSCN